jgi:hypothetical protein
MRVSRWRSLSFAQPRTNMHRLAVNRRELAPAACERGHDEVHGMS